MSKVVYKASCLGCRDFYIGKTERRLHDRKTELCIFFNANFSQLLSLLLAAAALGELTGFIFQKPG